MIQLRVTLIMLVFVALGAGAIFAGFATTREVGVILFVLFAAYLVIRFLRQRS